MDDSILFSSLLLAKNDTHSIERSIIFFCLPLAIEHNDTVANTVAMHAAFLKNHEMPLLRPVP